MTPAEESLPPSPADRTVHESKTTTRRVSLRFSWQLPIAWLALTLGSFAHPGDDLRMLALGDPIAILVQALTGSLWLTTGIALVLYAALGRGLDELRTPSRAVIASVLAFAVLFVVLMVSGRTPHDVAAKDGSVLAPILAALRLGLTSGALACLVLRGVQQFVRMVRADLHGRG